MKSKAEVVEAWLLISVSAFFLPESEEKKTAALTAKALNWVLGFDTDLDRVLYTIRKNAVVKFGHDN